MVTNVHGKEGDSLAKLLIRRSDDGVPADHAVSPSPDIGQISTDYGAALDDHFAIEHDVLGVNVHTFRIPNIYVYFIKNP